MAGAPVMELESVDSYLTDFGIAKPGEAQPGYDANVKASPPVVFRRLLRRKQPKAVPSQAFADLTAYRSRAAELLELLRSRTTGSDAERMTVLTQVAVKLAELVADLKSVGTGASEVQPLEKLLTDLRDSLGKQQASGELAGLWTEAEAVLHAFTGDRLTPPATKRRESFWK